MCTYCITINDTLIEQARPAFPDEKSLQEWLQEQVVTALEQLVGKNSAKEQRKMVTESLTRAFDELHSGHARKDARQLFS